MELEYIDKAGVKHDLDIFQGQQADQLVFTIHRNGNHFIDLERDQDRWIEVFSGPSERATDYGTMLDQYFVFTDRLFIPQKNIDKRRK